jgi:hypothetical protein
VWVEGDRHQPSGLPAARMATLSTMRRPDGISDFTSWPML